MTRRLLPMFLAGMILLVGLASAQQPGKAEDPTPRLKRKKRDGDTPPAPKLPSKDDNEQPKPKAKLPGDQEKAKEDPLEPEDGGGDPEEDEKDVLERIGRNMCAVEEKLSNRELGDPTSQQQRDIVRDLDSLIKKQQQSQSGGGGGGSGAQQPQGGADQKGEPQDKDKQGTRRSQQRSSQKSAGKNGQSRSQQRRERGQRSGRQRGGPGQQKGQPGSEQKQSQQQPSGGGNQPGGGGKSPESKKNLNADLYKEVWGHLPESLRAEMNAYSNPSPFMPRYDDLIKKYYRTIAEQGRKKGD